MIISAIYGTRRFTTCSHQPATGPYPEPDACNRHLPTLFPRVIIDISRVSILVSKWLRHSHLITNRSVRDFTFVL